MSKLADQILNRVEKMIRCAERRRAYGKRGYPGAVRRAIAAGRVSRDVLPLAVYIQGSGGPRLMPKGTTPGAYKAMMEEKRKQEEILKTLRAVVPVEKQS